MFGRMFVFDCLTVVRDAGQWLMHFRNTLPANVSSDRDMMMNLIRMSMEMELQCAFRVVPCRGFLSRI